MTEKEQHLVGEDAIIRRVLDKIELAARRASEATDSSEMHRFSEEIGRISRNLGR